MVVAAALAGAALPIASVIAQVSAGDCLYSGPDGPEPADCRPDPYGVGNEPAITAAIAGLGLDRSQIVFVGCAQGRFETRPAEGAGHSFRILYPLRANYDFATYRGPLMHELGHTFQVNRAGSLRALTQSLDRSSARARIELGADFLAGILYRRYAGSSDMRNFLQNLDLLGNYRPAESASHSSPEARAMAFQYGFIYNVGSGTIGAAHAKFQDDMFGGIMAQLRI